MFKTNDDAHGDGLYGVNVPNIFVQSLASVPQKLAPGDEVTHTLTLTNRGQGSQLDNFHIEIIQKGYQLKEGELPQGATLSVDKTAIEFNNLAVLGGDLADGYFDEGDVYNLPLKYTYSCGGTIHYIVSYNCIDVIDCKKAKDFDATKQPKVGFPKIKVSVPFANEKGGMGCAINSTMTTFTNIATAKEDFATNLILDFGTSWGNSEGKNIATDPSFGEYAIGRYGEYINKVYINGVKVPEKYIQANGAVRVDLSTLDDEVLATSLGLKDLDGDGFYDDLPAGVSLKVTAERDVKCSTKRAHGFLAARAVYSSLCNETKKHINWAGKKYSSTLTYRGMYPDVTIGFPSDINGGEAFDFSIENGMIYYPNKMYSDKPWEEFAYLELNFDKDMDFSEMEVVDTDGTTALNYTVEGSKKAIVKIPLSSYWRELKGIKFKKVKYPCSAANNWTLTFSQKIIMKPKQCPSCEVVFSNGQTKSAVIHKCFVGCEGFATTKVVAERVNFGWASQEAYLAGEPKLTGNEPGLQKGYVLSKGILTLKAEGQVSEGSFSDVGMKLSYATANNGFLFKKGTVPLIDKSTNTTYTAELNTPIATKAGGRETFNFVNSGYIFKPALPADFKYEKEDKINYEVVLKLDYCENTVFQSNSQLRAVHYGNTAGEEKSCDSFSVQIQTKKMHLWKKTVGAQDSPTIKGCAEQDLFVEFTPTVNNSSVRWNNEFRPYGQFNKVIFNSLEGYEYVPNSAIIGYYDKGSKEQKIAEPDAAQLKAGRVVLINDGTWKASNAEVGLIDNVGYFVLIKVRPTCKVVGDKYLQFSVQAEGKAMLTVAEPEDEKTVESLVQKNWELKYQKPTFSGSTSAKITATSKELLWNVSYSNTNTVSFDNTWLKITSPTGNVEVTSVTQGVQSWSWCKILTQKKYIMLRRAISQNKPQRTLR